MPVSKPVAYQLSMTNTQGDQQTAQLLKLLHEFKSLSVTIHDISGEEGIGYRTFQRVLTKELGMHRVAASP
jgi:aromatic ring-cleaving dioxygenase